MGRHTVIRLAHLSLLFLSLTSSVHAHKADFLLQDAFLGTDDALIQTKPSRSVAIIGAGAAGASAAKFLRQFTDALSLEPASITLFEASNRIGGRAQAVLIPDPSNPTKPPVSIEIGASIFITSNKHLMQSAQDYNLTLSSSLLDTEPPTNNPALGIYNGSDFVFTSSDSPWRTVFNTFWKWGLLSPYRARTLALQAASQFGNAYPLKESFHLGFKSIQQMLTRGFGMESSVLTKTARDYFLEKGIGDAFIREFIEPATRVNYGQGVELNAVGALICLAAAFTPTESIVGGNSLLYESMIRESGTLVKFETRTATQINFTTLAQTPAKFSYVHLHVTIVTGSLDHAYFNLPNPSAIPSAILTTASAGSAFNSIGTRHRFNDEQNTTVTKIFSSAKPTDAFLSQMYFRVVRVDRFEWDAYPVLNTWIEGEDGPSIVLDESATGGVYWVNGFEAAFSAMESETVASANVVQLLLEKWKSN
ncbi:hypothetical protein BCR33DRAFT_765885 [Rhizoclosmatium globosum]|uniref:Prenylcysteine lyase domain-containing protein n=1 Tax=Rhizoclosmatium globosum TaxID=329046 RepID=A0A1Y2CEY6_9FUNG|nr:hypothetical protein BCR33DRAFT_765885 [Rhizoclosmatium globosum]|eukprot:ORY44865.1 hypothetical protein BCR33DRAFT_765885 [Rhizoclosmatium globosum]